MKNLHGFKLEIIPVSEDDKLKRKAPSIVISYFVDSEPQLIKMSATQYEGNSNMNEMIKKIHQAKKELGLNNSELSLRMGKSRPYIAKMLNQQQSEKLQNKVIKQLDDILDAENYLKPYAEQAKKMQEDAKIIVCNSDNFKESHAKAIINNDPRDKEISDLKKTIESKDLAISGLIKQNDEAKKIHDKDAELLKLSNSKIFNLNTSVEQKVALIDELTYAQVWEQKQHKNNVNNLKSKIKRERIIILIVIVILTALFFLKGSIGG